MCLLSSDMIFTTFMFMVKDNVDKCWISYNFMVLSGHPVLLLVVYLVQNVWDVCVSLQIIVRLIMMGWVGIDSNFRKSWKSPC